MVADGIGGISEGEKASEIAVRSVSANLERLLQKDTELTAAEIKSSLGSAFSDALSGIDTYSRVKLDGRPMGTTLTAVVIDQGLAYTAHIGDTKSYLIRDGEINQMTTDHNSKKFKQGHVLTKALTAPEISGGSRPDIEEEPLELTEGDILAVCSDGLKNCRIPDQTIAQTMLRGDSLQTSCDNLVTLANANGGRDNISIVVAKLE